MKQTPRNSTPRPLHLLALFVALGLAAGSTPALAQATDGDLGDMGTFLTLFPTVRTAPGPAALVPGVRVSYQSGGAVIGSPVPASGGGVIQYDIVTRDAGQILAYQINYANDGAGAYPLATSFARGYPGIGPFWINPAALVGAESKSGAGLVVNRTAKTLPTGQTVQVMRFQTTTTNGQTVFEFDLATGLLVFSSVSTGPSAAQLTLLTVRPLASPWGLARAPNWVRPGAAVNYSGSKTTNIPGSPGIAQQVDFATQITAAGARWSVASATQAIGGRNQGGGFIATGQGQLLGGLWVPVSALATQLDPNGTRIDVDPITNAELYVGRAENGGVIIQEITPASRSTSIYSPNLGVLDRSIQEVSLQTAVVVTDVQRVTPDAPLLTLAQQAPLPEDPGGAGGGGCALGSRDDPGATLILVALGLMILGALRWRGPLGRVVRTDGRG